jgi:hypothetical protein
VTDKPWSKELGLMFVAMCEGLGFVHPRAFDSLLRRSIESGLIHTWPVLLNHLSGYLKPHVVPNGLLHFGPGPWVKIPDIQTAALVQYLGEALGWPPPEGCH